MSLADREKENAQALQDALAEEDPSAACNTLAVRLVARGTTQMELEKLNSGEFVNRQRLGDEPAGDALADTLDLIVGWCQKDKALFPKRTDEPQG